MTNKLEEAVARALYEYVWGRGQPKMIWQNAPDDEYTRKYLDIARVTIAAYESHQKDVREMEPRPKKQTILDRIKENDRLSVQAAYEKAQRESE